MDPNACLNLDTKLYFYKCVNRRCRQHGKEFSTPVTPQHARALTGRPVLCVDCGDVQRLVRVAEVR